MIEIKLSELLNEFKNSKESEPSKIEIEYETLEKNSKIILEIIQKKISKNLIPKDKLKDNYLDILNDNEIKKRNFLQKLYVSNIKNEPELTSLLYYLFDNVNFEESKFYLIKILPRCHDELSFLMCSEA